MGRTNAAEIAAKAARGAAAGLQLTVAARSVQMTRRRIRSQRALFNSSSKRSTGLPGWTQALSAAAAGGEEGGIVKVEVAAGVATLTLNDNKKRNALSSAMMATLRDTIKELEV